MAAGEAAESRLAACCISHEFYKAASQSPDKVAVIHATGFSRTARVSGAASQADGDGAESASAESRPPVYEGDECFTFADILSAVDKLSWRLGRVLHGAGHPPSTKPRPVNTLREDTEESSHASEHLQSSSRNMPQPNNIRSTRPPKVVGIYMEPSVEYIVAVLSVLRCGEAFMPLDPTWPKGRILSLISYSKADLVIATDMSVEGNGCHNLDSSKWLVDVGQCPVLSFSLKETANKESHQLLSAWPCESNSLRSFCYLMYTSGSTGKPKGVCGTEIGLLNRLLWMQEMYPLHGGDVVLFKTSISFIDHMQEFLGSVLSTWLLH